MYVKAKLYGVTVTVGWMGCKGGTVGYWVSGQSPLTPSPIIGKGFKRWVLRT